MSETIWWALGYPVSLTSAQEGREGMVDAFAGTEVLTCRPRPSELVDFKQVIPSAVPWPVRPEEPVGVPNLEAFRDNLLHHTNTALRYLDSLPKPWSNFCVTGSSVIRCLTRISQQPPTSITSDWDIFVFGATPEERKAAIRTLLESFPTDTLWIACGSVIYGYLPDGNGRPVQIINTDCPNARAVVVDFDSHSVGAFYDGEGVFMTPECVEAFQTRIAIPRPGIKMQDRRVQKYLNAGFSVARAQTTPWKPKEITDEEECPVAHELPGSLDETARYRVAVNGWSTCLKNKMIWWSGKDSSAVTDGSLDALTVMTRTGY
jgi:hypothetical protein